MGVDRATDGAQVGLAPALDRVGYGERWIGGLEGNGVGTLAGAGGGIRF